MIKKNLNRANTLAWVPSQVNKLKSLRSGLCAAKARARVSSSSSGLLPTTKDTQACHDSWKGH